MQMKQELKTSCPYPEIINDEVSGISVPSEKYCIWREGYIIALKEIGGWLEKESDACEDWRTFEQAMLLGLDKLKKGELPLT